MGCERAQMGDTPRPGMPVLGDDSEAELLIVDGKQRLTTLTC